MNGRRALRRLDAELVKRGLARSRQDALDLIASGVVVLDGNVASKASTQVGATASISVKQDAGEQWVSRGAHKLLGALDAFDINISGRDCLDAGASTGGFTQVLLAKGAKRVIAVDVGYGQLAWQLQTDDRVTVLDRTNVRNLTADDLPFVADLVVADLSFISLRTVLPALVGVGADEADLVLMVKPQFEVGRGRVGGGGVVRSQEDRADAVKSVADSAFELGLGVAGLAASPLPGPSGNVEFFLWLHAGSPPISHDELERVIREPTDSSAPEERND